MLHTHSITIDPLGPTEAEELRRRARAERGFDAVARHASRLTFLSAASGGRLDPEAAVGLRLSEADAVLALAPDAGPHKGGARLEGWSRPVMEGGRRPLPPGRRHARGRSPG